MHALKGLYGVKFKVSEISYSGFKVQVYSGSIDTSCTDDPYQQIRTWLGRTDGQKIASNPPPTLCGEG